MKTRIDLKDAVGLTIEGFTDNDVGILIAVGGDHYVHLNAEDVEGSVPVRSDREAYLSSYWTSDLIRLGIKTEEEFAEDRRIADEKRARDREISERLMYEAALKTVAQLKPKFG